PGPHARYPARADAAAHPEAAAGVLLPALPGAAQDLQEGAGGGGPGSLDRRRLDPAGGRSGAGDGPDGDLEVDGLEALQGDRRAGLSVPGTAALRRLAVS